MKVNFNVQLSTVLVLIVFLVGCSSAKEEPDEWIELFNGKDLTGWKANETDETFQVVDGILVAVGERSHLYFTGNDQLDGDIKNFELEAKIMTTKLANSGIYFHTEWQEKEWLSAGHEAQINVSHKGAGDYREVKKGGSLYGIRNVYKSFAQDSVWYVMKIKVEDKRIRIWMNDILTVDYVEPVNPARFGVPKSKVVSSGNFALQGHDPESKVMFEYVRVRPLPDDLKTENVPVEEINPVQIELQASHIPIIDFNIAVDEATDKSALMAYFYQTGINLGFVDQTPSSDFITSNSKLPVFFGAEINDEGSSTEGFDYTIYQTQFPEVTEDMQAFMDEYLKQNIEKIKALNPDILGLTTALPEELMPYYDELWTPGRIEMLLAAMMETGTAVEVNLAYETPSLPIILAAKEKGLQFTVGQINIEAGEEGLAYLFTAIEKAELDYKDFYIPDPNLN